MKIKDIKVYSSDDTEVIFKGKKYFLIGDLEGGWAIATKFQYDNWLPSYAHLFPNGFIKRYNVLIGTVEDLKQPKVKKTSKNDNPKVKKARKVV